MTMRAGRQSRNADFKTCGEATTTTLRPLGLSPLERQRTQSAAVRRPQPSGRRPVNPHTGGVSNGAARIGGGERSEPISRMLIMSYDTESKSRNVLASPLGEEGHEVAKGCTRVRMIMTLDVDVTGKAAL